MLNFNSVLIGSTQPEVLAAFYAKVFAKPADFAEGGYSGWQVGSAFVTVGPHSEMKGSAKEPARVLLNFETEQVKEEFARVKGCGEGAVPDGGDARLDRDAGRSGRQLLPADEPDGPRVAPTAPAAAMGLAALLVLMFPANVRAARERLTIGRPATALRPRSLMQVAFLAALVGLRLAEFQWRRAGRRPSLPCLGWAPVRRA